VLAILSSRADRLIWGAVAILIAVVLGRALKVIAGRLGERRPSEEHELQQLRTRETAIVLVATAIPYATAIVVLIVLASIFLPVAVLGGSAFLAIVLGFAAQRFLMDIVAGILIGFERWYAVGDFLMLEPTKASGIVEQFGLRTTVLQSLNGDLVYVPNSQIIAAIRSPRGYRRYSIELITSDADAAQRAIEGVGRRGPAGEARFLRPPTSSRCVSWGRGPGLFAVVPMCLRRWSGSRRTCWSTRSRPSFRKRCCSQTDRLHARPGRSGAIPAPSARELRRSLALVGLLVPNR
jgi:hypothetical protein